MSHSGSRKPRELYPRITTGWCGNQMMSENGPQTVVLIQCSKTKRSETCKARDLYDTGHAYFKLMKDFGEVVGDAWFILSAKHALLHPDERVAPYDVEMKDVDGEPWAREVADELETAVGGEGVTEVILSAGSDYTDPLTPELETREGFAVSDPFVGMKIGARQSELKRRTEQALDARSVDA